MNNKLHSVVNMPMNSLGILLDLYCIINNYLQYKANMHLLLNWSNNMSNNLSKIGCFGIIYIYMGMGGSFAKTNRN